MSRRDFMYISGSRTPDIPQGSHVLEDEFAFVGKEDAPAGHHFGTGEGDGKLVWNGGGEALAYASGRRGVDGLQILFSLTPFHDPFELLYTFLYNAATGSSAAVIGRPMTKYDAPA